jgi:hypothetical protein
MRCSKILWKSTQFGNSRVSFGKHEIGINTRSLTEIVFKPPTVNPAFKPIRQTIVGIVVASELGRAKTNSIPQHIGIVQRIMEVSTDAALWRVPSDRPSIVAKASAFYGREVSSL